jgi:Zn-dependent peptidase ImmA (M78 family)
MVFQATGVATSECVDSLSAKRYNQIIVVNRKDSYTGRIFSLFHELTHILLRTSGLCDLDSDISLPPEEQLIEVFCNKVAAEVLMPGEAFIEAISRYTEQGLDTPISDRGIAYLADTFGVSREAIVRRMLTFGIVTKDFYQHKRDQYIEELLIEGKKKKQGGGIPRAIDVVSLAGKPYIRLVFHSLDANRITLNDASGYLNIKINQLQKTGELAGHIRDE